MKNQYILPPPPFQTRCVFMVPRPKHHPQNLKNFVGTLAHDDTPAIAVVSGLAPSPSAQYRCNKAQATSIYKIPQAAKFCRLYILKIPKISNCLNVL